MNMNKVEQYRRTCYTDIELKAKHKYAVHFASAL